MRRNPVLIFLLLASSLCFPSYVRGQQTLGAIAGSATDAAGAVLPGVQVQLLSEKNGFTRATHTNRSGEYQFLNLPVGAYTLTFTLDGFDQAKFPHIGVNENRTTTLAAPLKAGSVNTSITVNETPLLNAVDTTEGYTLNQHMIQTLPLATGSFTQLAILAPGVNAEFLAGTGTNAGLGNQPVWANGQRDTSNTYTVNGVDITNLFNGKTTSQSVSQRLNFNIGEGANVGGNVATNTSVYGSSGQSLASPPPEFTQQITVNVASYSAQQGTTSGAHIDVNTISGSNQWHGQMWATRGTNWLNAAPFFYKSAAYSIPHNQQNPELHRFMGGVTAGGPLIHNRLFLFGGYQAQRVTDQTTGFSPLAVPIGLTNDRSTPTLLNICSQFVSSGCTLGNVDPAALAIFQYKLGNGQYLIPNANANANPNGVNDAQLIQSSRFDADQFTGALDYDVNSVDRLSLKYFFQHDPTFSPYGVSQTSGFPQQEDSGAQVASVQNNWVVNPHFNWEQHFGYSRQKVYSTFQPALTASAVGIQTFYGDYFPGISIRQGVISPNNSTGVGFGPNNSFVDDGYFQNRFAPTTNAIFSVGRHNLASGVNFAYTQLNIVNNGTGHSLLSFNNLGDFFQGKLHNGSILLGNARRYYRTKEVGAYVQDQWQVRPNLSLTGGFRYDWNGPFTEANGNLFNFDPSRFQATETAVINDGFIVAGNNKLYHTPGVSASTLKGRQWGLSPRIGFAWSPMQDKGRIVFRGSYGIYYDRGEYFQYLSPPAGQGVSGPFGVTQEPPLAGFAFASGTLSQPFGNTAPPLPSGNPADFASLLPTAAAIKQACTAANVYNATSATGYSCGVKTFPIGNYNINNKLPYAENYMLDMQWQPRNDLAITIGYTGNIGKHLIIPLPFNQPKIATPARPVNGEIYSYGYQVLSPTNTDVNGNPAPMSTEPYDTFDGGNVDLRTPYPGYDPNSTSFTANGISNYNALQTQIEQRMSHGIQMGLSYTFSHTLDEQSDLGLFFTGDNPNRLRDSYATADFDRTHVASLNFLFEAPNLKSGSRIVRKFTNGWQMVGIAIFQSGQPYSIYDYTGAVASQYYGTNVSLLNPIVPLAPGYNASNALTGHSGAFFDAGGNPIPAIKPEAIAVPLQNAPAFGQTSTNGVPPCDASGGPNGGQLCDTYETTFAAPGLRNIFRQAFQKRADVSFQKTTVFFNRYQVLYSFDVFNLTNTTSFDIPNNNTSIGGFAYGGNFNGSQVQPNASGPQNAVGTLYTLPTEANLNGFAQVVHTIGSPRIVQMSLHFIY